VAASEGFWMAGQRSAEPTWALWQVAVTKLYQNPIYLVRKGFDFERKQNPRKLGTAWEEKR
jgi:hypothetical protein